MWKPTIHHAVLALASVVVLAIGAGVWDHFHRPAQDESALTKLLQHQLYVNDSTQTILAETQAQLKQLQGLSTAAKTIGGKPIAGVAIRVLRHDTTVVHDTIATVRFADSSRTGTFHDSTFAGLVDVKVTAPRFPAALSAVLHVTRPEFRPEIGFVKVGNVVMATVVWQGEKYQIEAPFLDQKAFQVPVKRFTPWAEGFYGIASAPQVAAGAGVNVWKVQLSPTIRQVLSAGQTPSVGITLRWTF